MNKPHLSATTRRRRSVRLQGYDYAQAGVYFVTVVTQRRACLFGEVVDQEMQLNDAGTMVRQVWLKLPDRFPGIATDEFVGMPNHVHGIININEPVGAPLVGAQDAAAQSETTSEIHHRATTRVAPTQYQNTAGPREATIGNTSRAATRAAPTANRRHGLGEIVGAFKSLTTVAYVRGVKKQRWTPFSGKLWQRNYFEHVVRSEESLDKLRRYVRDNPARWELDRENPLAHLEP